MTRAGIYKITNKIDNKVYIGQSIDLDLRLKHHRHYLTKYKHHNQFLQRAVNKHNLENFVFEIIEIIEPFDNKDKDCLDILNFLESFYIESYESLNNQNGYNLKPGGNSSSGFFMPNTLKYTFYDPDNNLVEIDNLNKFCQENKLNASGMRRVFSEDQYSSKGWTKYKKTSKKYKIKSPDNIIFEFDNITEFAKEHDLNLRLLSKVLNGHREHCNYWTLPETILDYNNLVYYSCPVNKFVKYNWINLQTKEEIYCTVNELCNKLNIDTSRASIYKITDPNNNARTFNAWTLKNIEKIKLNPVKRKYHTTYKFKHEIHGIFEGTENELSLKYPELHKTKINNVVNKTRPHHKGWYLLEN